MLLSLGSPSQLIGLVFLWFFQVSASVVFPRAACLKCIGPFLFLVSLDAPFPFFLRPFYIKGMQKIIGRIVKLLPCLTLPKLLDLRCYTHFPFFKTLKPFLFIPVENKKCIEHRSSSTLVSSMAVQIVEFSNRV